MTPDLANIIGLLRAGGEQMGPNPSLEKLRAAIIAMNSALPLPDGVTYTDVSGVGVSGVWSESADAARHRVILYFHGGGYVAGNAQAFRGLTGEIGRLAEARTFSLEYRLAPEHPFPAAVEDALAAYRWLLDQGFAAASIAVAGDSAGGGLGLAMLLAARQAGLPLPAAAYLLSPWVDLALTGSTFASKADVELLATPDALRGFVTAYLGDKARENPLASPLYGDLAGLPPMLIQVGSEETLLDDAVRLAGKAGTAKVAIQLEIVPEVFHDFQVWYPMLLEARQAIARAAVFLRAHMA